MASSDNLYRPSILTPLELDMFSIILFSLSRDASDSMPLKFIPAPSLLSDCLTAGSLKSLIPARVLEGPALAIVVIKGESCLSGCVTPAKALATPIEANLLRDFIAFTSSPLIFNLLLLAAT